MILRDQQENKVYSDGEETEQRMLSIAQKYPEDLSQDFIANCSEYAINNTFSSVRQNILNWYPFKEHASILEVGAGMGAITGMLCDRAEHVTVIEMSEARADVIKARYGGRSNLNIISKNVNDWDSEEKFDYIVFIGVLEYAAVFSENRRPYDEFLLSIKRLLKEDGILLFAIENRFGLKYWLGASEDHLQKPFIGIEGYKKPKTARTFSRKELEIILDRVGLTNHRFYSVLPDYKFPELIFTDEYVPDYMNLKKVSFAYSKGSSLVADEKDLYKDIVENGVFSFFANSFLVEASGKELASRHVIHVSAKGEVYKDFRVSTVMDNEDRVYKIPMHRNASAHIDSIVDNTEYLAKRGVPVLTVYREKDAVYSERHDGVLAQKVFREALKNGCNDIIYELIDALKESFLKSSSIVEYNINNILVKSKLQDEEVNYGVILQKAFIDMTFYNAFWEEGKLLFFDQEWCFERVPLNFCLYYAVKSAYSRADVETETTLDDILKYTGIHESETAAYDRLEEYLWSNVLYRQTDFYGADGYCSRYNGKLTFREQKAKFEQEKNELENAKRVLESRNLDLENENAYLKQEVLSKAGHIELLLETERKYEHEKGTHSYKLAKRIQKIGDGILPPGSRRRFFARVLFNLFRHPHLMLHVINFKRIKHYLKYMKLEGMEGVNKRYEEAVDMERIQMDPMSRLELDLEPINSVALTANKDVSDYEKIEFPFYRDPIVSVIIPTYNEFNYTYNCLKSILKNSGDTAYEILIADDCSTDVTRDVEKIVKNIRLVTTNKNAGFLLNCNHAAKYAQGKYILFLNNDTQVQKDWLEPMVNLIEQDERIGIVGSKLIYPDGRLQEAGGIIWKDASAWNYGNQKSPEDPEYNYVKEVDYISGASVMVRKTVWEEIGGFDERFAPAYCEDSDLAFEVRKRGYKVVYQPRSVVVHFEGVSNGTNLSRGLKACQIINQKKFKEKWSDTLEEHFPNAENVFTARDRSNRKKVLLMIDHYVPQYDKDAGSRTVFQYLRMFVDKGYHVKFIGDNFYRPEPYTTALQQMGIEVLYGPYYADHWKEWIRDNSKYIDYVFLNRPHISVKYIDYIRSHTKAKIIYYGHDLHFLREMRRYELTRDRKALEKSDDWKKKELELMKKADVVYYPSYVEVQEIAKIAPEVKAKAVIAYVFEDMAPGNYEFDKRRDIMFVGGFTHTPNVDAVLWFTKEVLPGILEEMPDIIFYIIGSNAPLEIQNLADKNIVVKGFVSDEELAQFYDNCRISVVPLRYGAGIKGKVIEAMRYGMPVVTTSTGAEGIEGAEQILCIEDNVQAMVKRFVQLYNDKTELEKMSKESVEYIRDNYSADSAWRVIEKDFS